MTRPIAVLRPEPGNARTAERLADVRLEAIRLPLFAVRAVAWTPPDLGGHDSLLLTSANAVRHAGAGLAAVAALPVIAVGAETARAARGAGLRVAITGTADVVAAIGAGRAAGFVRPLHLAGRDRIDAGVPAITPYASDAVVLAPGTLAVVSGSVALLHSVRAAERFAELVAEDTIDPATIRLAALSPAILAAAGAGWGEAHAAAAPDEVALLALAARLAD